MTIYNRERKFVVNFLAALSLSGCKKVDIDDEKLNRYMPLLKNKVTEEDMFNKRLEVDALYLLFMKDVNGYYRDIMHLINNVKSIALINEEDNSLDLFMDEKMANEILEDQEFSRDSMISIAKQMLPVIKKSEKVKVYEINRELARV